MRTVIRESVKLNKAKFETLERIARAFAKDKQAHLDFYQQDLNFSEAESYRLRRNEVKTTNHHASTPLPVHASDLAVKEAFETEIKYWAAIAAEIHPRIASCQWTPEQKHYAYWLLSDEHRFSLLILDRSPINEKISLVVGERKQVQNYLRRRARRIMKARPSVKIRRRNLGHKKSQELKRRTKITITNQINRAINELIKKREPKIIVTEKLEIRGKGPSKEISRRVSYWHRSTLKDRFEFKASAAGCRRRINQRAKLRWAKKQNPPR